MDDNSVRGTEAAQHQGVNGAVPESNGQPQEDGRERAVRQAEEMADRLLERAEFYASWLSRQVMKLAARAREEAVDIWAEAEYVSRQWQSPSEKGKDEV